MRIEKLSIPCALIAALLAFGFAGCKDRVAEQTLVSRPEIVQQKPEGGSVSTDAQTDEPTAVSPGAGGNHPPKIISMVSTPEIPVVGSLLTAEVKTFDQDGDAVSVIYEWSLNDLLLSESTNSLKITEAFKRGDSITLKATPNDGGADGRAVTMVFHIANAPPVIQSSQNTLRFDGNRYAYQIYASDADKDPLTYSLSAGPPGMQIHPATGQITWIVPPEFSGKAMVTVSVADGNGGETLQSFSLDIKRDE